MFNFSWSQDADTVTVYSEQTTSSASTPLFKTPIDFLFSYNGGDTLIRVYQDENIQEFSFTIPYQVSSLSVDPDNMTGNVIAIPRRNDLTDLADVQEQRIIELYSK